MLRSPIFEEASLIIENWLDSFDPMQVSRLVSAGRNKPRTWMLHLDDPVLSTTAVRLVLQRDFPASVPRIEIDKRYCLVLPHVEEDGKVCLGVDPTTADFLDPAAAIVVVLDRFKKLLESWHDPEWCQQEFQKECLSYWLRFCDAHRKGRHARPVVKRIYIALADVPSFIEGKAAVYDKEQIAVLSSTQDPHVLARRHNLANGTLQRGSALFVALHDDEEWTPSVWPRSLPELEALVERVTEGACSIVKWVKSKQDRKRPFPFFVVLVRGTVSFAYQLMPSVVPHLVLPGIVPLLITRLDPTWALTRDQKSEVFRRRQVQKVLLVGCGSLGSAVAELLARAGIGTMDLVDSQLFYPENISRHTLGMSDAHRSKAVSLSARLFKEVPGLNVKGHVATAVPWLVEQAKRDAYDVIVDCTGESAVRGFLSMQRAQVLGQIPVIHAWMEPFGAAAHVVSLNPRDTWPLSDPVETHINAAKWPDSARIRLPACSDGFHPYGVSDAWQAAGLTSECVLSALESPGAQSTVTSWVRSRAFFVECGAEDAINTWLPPDIEGCRARTLLRSYSDVMAGND